MTKPVGIFGWQCETNIESVFAVKKYNENIENNESTNNIIMILVYIIICNNIYYIQYRIIYMM